MADMNTVKELVAKLHEHLNEPSDVENTAGVAGEANTDKEVGFTTDPMHEASESDMEAEEEGDDRLPKRQKRHGMF